MPTATLTATTLDLDAAGLLLVAEVEAYLRTVGRQATPAPARTLLAPTACWYGQTVQPWHAGITLPQPTALDRLRRRRPVAQVTVRQHLELVSKYIHQFGWAQGQLWDEQGRVCVLGAQLRVLAAGYGTAATVTEARLQLGNQLGRQREGQPIDQWNDRPGRRVGDVHQLLRRAAAHACRRPLSVAQ